MNEYGWAVYEGVNTWDVGNVGNLLEDLRDLVNIKMSDVLWNDLQHQNRVQGTHRWHVKITKEMLDRSYDRPIALKIFVNLYLDKIFLSYSIT